MARRVRTICVDDLDQTPAALSTTIGAISSASHAWPDLAAIRS